MKQGILQKLTLFAFCICIGSTVCAQPFATSAHEQPADTTGIVAKTESNPPNDAVLISAPKHLNMVFPSAVRLVKLTLRNEQRDWVDISFRYSPSADVSYEWISYRTN